MKEWHGGKVHEIRPHVLHLMRGQVFEIEDRNIFDKEVLIYEQLIRIS